MRTWLSEKTVTTVKILNYLRPSMVSCTDLSCTTINWRIIKIRCQITGQAKLHKLLFAPLLGGINWTIILSNVFMLETMCWSLFEESPDFGQHQTSFPAPHRSCLRLSFASACGEHATQMSDDFNLSFMWLKSGQLKRGSHSSGTQN